MDEDGLTYEELDAMIGTIFLKIVTGQPILPMPELPQDLAFIAFTIDRLRGMK